MGNNLALQRVEQMLSLEYNWNGYGGKCFSIETVDLAKKIIKETPLNFNVYPTGRGTIQLQIGTSDDKYLELEVYSDHISTLEVFRYYSLVAENTFESNKLSELYEHIGGWILK